MLGRRVALTAGHDGMRSFSLTENHRRVANMRCNGDTAGCGTGKGAMCGLEKEETEANHMDMCVGENRDDERQQQSRANSASPRRIRVNIGVAY